MAGDRETAGVTVLFAAEAVAGIEVGQVIDQLVERIRYVLQGGGDGEPVFLLKETDDPPAARGHPRGVHQAEAPPEHGDAGGPGEIATDGGEMATGAVVGEDFALDWLVKR